MVVLVVQGGSVVVLVLVEVVVVGLTQLTVANTVCPLTGVGTHSGGVSQLQPFQQVPANSCHSQVGQVSP